MKNCLRCLIVSLLVWSCSTNETTTTNNDPEPDQSVFLKGADLSFLPQIEASDYQYYNANDQIQDALTILKNNGLNVVRLRLWKDPESSYSSLAEVKTFVQRIKNNGLKVWLTLHYSDTWADPGTQDVPLEWQNITFEALKDSVYNYTKKVVTETQPDYIQIGNEINQGFLWPQGHSNNLSQFKDLLKEGLQAVRDHSNAERMIHFAGHNGAISFFNNLTDLDYDIIALSYYPFWHGESFTTLESSMVNLKTNFDKEVVIAETAYPFTLDWNDFTNNIIGLPEHVHPDFPATQQGQKDFLIQLRTTVENSNGFGFCYWAPEWVAFDGAMSSNGSAWENLALFDFEGKVTSAMEILQD